MIRPATPLTVLLFAALGLLVITVISTPVITAIPLGSFDGINFGVFGWCKADGTCSGYELGYDTSALFSVSDSATFDLPISTRTTLSTILVLHPVAAFLTLVMLILAIIAHFHAPAHSVRYLLAVFIISIFTLLAALLAFLIDVLLFVPHMAFGSFLALAAVILIALSSIVSCAMRRTLVSRKTRQRRIDANAEMSGENFYNRQAQTAATVVSASAAPSSLRAESPPPMPAEAIPPVKGGPGGEITAAGISDEQIPLTSQYRADEQQRSNDQFGRSSPNAMMMTGANNSASNSAVSMNMNQPSRQNTQQRDAYGNAIPYGAPNPAGPNMAPDGYGRRPSMDRMNNNMNNMNNMNMNNMSMNNMNNINMNNMDRMNNMNNMQYAPRGRGGPGGFRGRGGGPGPYGPPQGRGGPYGMQNGGRGGNYGPPGRGGYGGYGGMAPPNGRGRGRGGFSQRGRPPPPGYRYDQPPNQYGGGPNAMPPPPVSYNNGNNPNFMNNANPSNNNINNINNINNNNMGGGDGYNAYAPAPERPLSGDLPRAESPPPLPRAESPPPLPGVSDNIAEIPAPIGQAVEMDASTGTGGFGPQQNRYDEGDDEIAGMVNLQQGRTASSSYSSPNNQFYNNNNNSNISNNNNNNNASQPPPPGAPLQKPHINVPPPIIPYDDTPQGARSPAESERSNFTSISQRGINPQWNPPPQGMMPGYGPGGLGGPGGPGFRGPGYGGPRRGPMRDRNDVLLETNPDFSLPGTSTTRRPVGGGPLGPSNLGSGGGAGMVPGSAYPPIV